MSDWDAVHEISFDVNISTNTFDVSTYIFDISTDMLDISTDFDNATDLDISSNSITS